MQIINTLPRLLTCLQAWEKLPSEKTFEKEYFKPLQPLLQPMLDDFSARMGYGFYEVLKGLNWDLYRSDTLKLDPVFEEARLENHMRDVEKLLGVKLKGETVLFGAFTMMDGYARFDRGTHRVYLGVDENHGRGRYLDILLTHELTHVARESQASVWEGFGLNPKMTHDEFTENQPVVEHLFSEGFSCVVSEILNPGSEPWGYVYQDKHSLAQILEHSKAIDLVVHGELNKKDGDYGVLYNVSRYRPPVPLYAHYVWAWRWVKTLLKEFGENDPKKLLTRCSKDFLDHAKHYTL